MKKRIALTFLTVVFTICAAFAACILSGCDFLGGIFHKHVYGDDGGDWYFCVKCGKRNAEEVDVTAAKYFEFRPIEDEKGETVAYAVHRMKTQYLKITLPETYDGLPVTTLDGTSYNYGLERLICSDNLREIKAGALSGGVDILYLGNGVETIDENAFSREVLPSVSHSSETLYVAAGNKKFKVDGDCLIDIDNKRLLMSGKNPVIPQDASVEYINPIAFYMKSGFKEITIPSGVKEVESSTFYHCGDLEKVVFKEGVESVGNGAFTECPKLTMITFADSINSIGTSAFAYCGRKGNKSITVVLPKNLKKLGDRAFDSSNVGSVSLNDGLESIGRQAFHYAKMQFLFLPDSVKEVGDSAFRFCTYLKRVTGCRGLETINSYAFADCDRLEYFEPSDSITVMKYHAFAHCTLLKEFRLSKNLKIINGFQDCIGLTDFTVFDGAEEIGYDAFHYCTNLKTVTLPKTITKINGAAFRHCDSLEKIIYKGTEAEWKLIEKASDWREYSDNFVMEFTEKPQVIF